MKAWTLWILLLCTGPVCAADKNDPVLFPATARVELDAEGVPRGVQASSRLPVPVREAIERRVAQWRFEPARVDGVAKPGITHVRLQACAIPRPDGSLHIGMDYQGNGPGYANDALRLPRLPYPPAAARAGSQADIDLHLLIGEDGLVTLQSMKATRGSVKEFKAMLEAWVAAMRYVPEEVDGRPIATQLRIPVEFFMSERSRRREHQVAAAKTPECIAAAGQSDAPVDPVVLDSPFKPLQTG
ncbi:energy transducer TonB [Pseudoxanthomonas sp.]|jgi:hypothetical protein|uniref:energy transducer TonB n=1 Tax=Pseudoxanthomonas sp. TaxID=1871049 RepID=UPI002E147866|nr:energy transducer TonB [Pseudoxanthomonas sp.]